MAGPDNRRGVEAIGDGVPVHGQIGRSAFDHLHRVGRPGRGDGQAAPPCGGFPLQGIVELAVAHGDVHVPVSQQPHGRERGFVPHFRSGDHAAGGQRGQRFRRRMLGRGAGPDGLSGNGPLGVNLRRRASVFGRLRVPHIRGQREIVVVGMRQGMVPGKVFFEQRVPCGKVRLLLLPFFREGFAGEAEVRQGGGPFQPFKFPG